MSKANKEALKAQAAEREAAWRALSPKEQLAVIDRRLGVGQGAKKQRARIAKALAEEKAGK
jgi:hypothetical protein